MAKYWSYAINNANTVATILNVQDWMTLMAETIRNAQSIPDHEGPSKPPPTSVVHESQDDGTAIEVSSGPTFGFDDLDMNEANQPEQSDDTMMIFDEEKESSRSQHSTSKPKEKKRRRNWQFLEKNF